MAVWQFEVALDPSGQPRGSNNSLSEPERGSLFNRDDSDILRKIDSILPRRASWSENLILFGEEDGNRLHAILDGGRIVELTARIDLRQPSGSFPAQLVELARFCDAQFSIAEGQQIPPELSCLSEAVRQSDACRFVLDPQHYFGELVGHPAT